MHKLPKTQGLGTSSSKRSADLPREAAVHREGEDEGKTRLFTTQQLLRGAHRASLSQDCENRLPGATAACGEATAD